MALLAAKRSDAKGMPPVPTHSLQTIHLARQLYKDGKRVRDICAITGMSVGTLYYHLDGFSLPGLAAPQLARRRDVRGEALATMPSRGRKRMAARLWRAAEQQARKVEFRLTYEHQTREGRAEDLAALKELTRILKDLAAAEEAAARAEAHRRAPTEEEEALAVEGRAVFLKRTRRG
jgi:hypothetical protein